MARVEGVAMTAGGLLARAAVGFLGLAIVIGWGARPPGPAARATSGSGDPPKGATTVTLDLPEDVAAKHLIVVDASGRQLAVLTRWKSGGLTAVSRRVDGAGVCYHLEADGSARMLVEGTARVARVDADPDGTTRVTHQPAGFRVDRPLATETPTPTASTRDADPRSERAADREESLPPSARPQVSRVGPGPAPSGRPAVPTVAGSGDPAGEEPTPPSPDETSPRIAAVRRWIAGSLTASVGQAAEVASRRP